MWSVNDHVLVLGCARYPNCVLLASISQMLNRIYFVYALWPTDVDGGGPFLSFSLLWATGQSVNGLGLIILLGCIMK